MIYDFSNKEVVAPQVAPQSVTILNNIALKMGSPDHIIVQMRLEVTEVTAESEDKWKRYSLQTGAVNISESQGLFYSYNKENKYRLVIETNYVSTWTSTKWDVLYLEDIDEAYSCSFVVYGNPEQIAVRKIVK